MVDDESGIWKVEETKRLEARLRNSEEKVDSDVSRNQTPETRGRKSY